MRGFLSGRLGGGRLGGGGVGRSGRAAACLNQEGQTTGVAWERFRHRNGRLAGLFVGLAAALMGQAVADRAWADWRDGEPPEGRLDYAVTREGSPVGKQSVEFLRTNTGFVVRTQVAIEVEFLLLTLYRFQHDSVETWENGRLEALVSRTDDDGKDRVVELEAQDGRLVGSYNGKPVDVPGDIVPASLWHPATVGATILLDPVRGRPREVTVQDLGNERIEAGGGEIEARHYAMTGQIERELWYDGDGRLVRVRFAAKDGSEIEVSLR